MFHCGFLLASIQWQLSINSNRRLGNCSSCDVLGNCSGTFIYFAVMIILFHRNHCYEFLTETQLFITIFQCFPVDQFWKASDEPISAQCKGSDAQLSMSVYLGGTIPHIITDAVLLVFSMPLVWKLKMRRAQKVMLVAIFALGAM